VTNTEHRETPPLGPRDYLNEEIIIKAWQDEGFRRRLVDDPRAALESELGIRIPAEMKLHIHEEHGHDLHLVLPPPPSALTHAVIGPKHLAAQTLAASDSKNQGTGTSDCHACASGVRG
jgi:hypothetical protein